MLLFKVLPYIFCRLIWVDYRLRHELNCSDSPFGYVTTVYVNR